MKDLERAVRASKRYEAALSSRFGATGRGLHEKIDRVSGSVSKQTLRDLRLIATVRNRLVHEEGYDRIERRGEFVSACRHVDRALGLRGGARLWLGLAVGALVVAVAAWLMLGT